MKVRVRERERERERERKCVCVKERVRYVVSILPASYEQIFLVHKFLRAAFLYLHFRFELFCDKKIGGKAALKKMVKLTL